MAGFRNLEAEYEQTPQPPCPPQREQERTPVIMHVSCRAPSCHLKPEPPCPVLVLHGALEADPQSIPTMKDATSAKIIL